MKRIFVIAALALTLVGCASFNRAIDVTRNAIEATSNITPQQIYVAANAFDAVEVSATQYLNLKRCPQNAPFCRSPSVTKQIIPLIRAGRIARNNAVNWARANPNGFADQSLYDKLTAITSTLQDMMRQYNIGG